MEKNIKGLMLNTEGFPEWDDEKGYKRFADSIYWAIENEPYEVFQTNKVGDVIETGSHHVWNWFIKILDEDNISLGERSLQYFMYLDRVHTHKWRKDLLHKAITHEDLYIRDAGVQLLEHWDQNYELLRERIPNEPVEWLKKYMQEVLDWADNEKEANDVR